MRAIAVVLALVAVGAYAVRSEASHLGCHTGEARAFAAVRSDPPQLVGTIPGKFTGRSWYFTSRYNCERKGAQVRRVDEGTYEVRFPGVKIRVAIADALSDEGVSSSVIVFDDTVRVLLRGPLAGEDVATRRDVPFNVVAF